MSKRDMLGGILGGMPAGGAGNEQQKRMRPTSQAGSLKPIGRFTRDEIAGWMEMAKDVLKKCFISIIYH